MHRALLTVALGSAIAIACGLSDNGTGDVVPAATMNGGGGADAGNGDVGGAIEAGSACADAGPGGAKGSMTAHQASSALVIDGELSDWSCAQFYVLDASSAAYPPNATAKSSAAIALMWTKDTLYFAARVTDATVAGTNATQPYENDAIELYLGGGAPMGTYGANDWHFVVDYSGFARAYQGNAGAAPPQGFASSSKKTATGYVIEISVSAAVLGMGSLAAGASIGFDVQLDDCNDVDAGRAGFVEYWLAPNQLQCDACACTTMEPYCDTYAFGKVALVAP